MERLDPPDGHRFPIAQVARSQANHQHSDYQHKHTHRQTDRQKKNFRQNQKEKKQTTGRLCVVCDIAQDRILPTLVFSFCFVYYNANA
jgi:hypothetical protein